MKHTLLGTTALAGALMLAAAPAAAEPPTWRLSGNANFQFYYADQDFTSTIQEHGWYFGVDESELQLNVSGAADNGLTYGFKVEINANTDDVIAADEVRLQGGGDWGVLQLGDEDGAEDIMNFGGENLMGATGGYDGDFNDILLRVGSAPAFPTIAGDTEDASKVSYFSARASGFQIGASVTPTPNDGDSFKQDGAWEDHYGLGVNYDSVYRGMKLRLSGVLSMASTNVAGEEDAFAWSVGGILNAGPVGIGANFTNNSDSFLAPSDESYYWDIALSYEIGPLYVSAGYFSSTTEWAAGGEDEFTNFAVTGDYNLAPGFGVYAELDLIEDSAAGGPTNDATIFIAGANISF